MRADFLSFNVGLAVSGANSEAVSIGACERLADAGQRCFATLATKG